MEAGATTAKKKQAQLEREVNPPEGCDPSTQWDSLATSHRVLVVETVSRVGSWR